MQRSQNRESAALTRNMPHNNLAPFICALSLSCLISACGATTKITADEALAGKNRVIHCEWKAADQYDDNRYKTMSELAHQVMDTCAVELRDARIAFGLSLNDSRIDTDELRDAMENIEHTRERRLRPSPAGKNSK
jgi:hypothetical protein